MNEQISDIASIPYFPYSPGILAWLSFTILSLAICAFLLLKSNLRGKKLKNQSLQLCKKELDSLVKKLDSQPELSRHILFNASLLVRRLISSLEFDISNFGASELQRFCQNCSSPALVALLESIVQIELFKFSASTDSSTALDLLQKTSHAFENYRDHRLTTKQ